MELRRAAALRVLPLIDLTSLEPADDAAVAERLAASAVTPFGAVAALCVMPHLVAHARRALAGTGVRVATVANFPDGLDEPDAVSRAVRAALDAGADEIDVVIPYAAFRDGDRHPAAAILMAARAASRHATMKVILETGALIDPALIRAAAEMAVAHGADFLKTSTGKIPVGATPAAVHELIGVIAGAGRPCGLKVSGGVRTLDDAAAYLGLHDAAFGPDAAGPERLRFGASSLLAQVLTAAVS